MPKNKINSLIDNERSLQKYRMMPFKMHRYWQQRWSNFLMIVSAAAVHYNWYQIHLLDANIIVSMQSL